MGDIIELVGTDKKIKLETRDADGYLGRAWNYLYQRQVTRALTDIRKAITLEPNNLMLHIDVARNLYGYGYLRQAADYFSHLKLDSSNFHLLRGILFYKQLQTSCHRMGEEIIQQSNSPLIARALDAYNKSLSLQPDQPYTFYSRGKLYFNLHKHKAAIEDFTQTVNLLKQINVSDNDNNDDYDAEYYLDRATIKLNQANYELLMLRHISQIEDTSRFKDFIASNTLFSRKFLEQKAEKIRDASIKMQRSLSSNLAERYDEVERYLEFGPHIWLLQGQQLVTTNRLITEIYFNITAFVVGLPVKETIQLFNSVNNLIFDLTANKLNDHKLFFYKTSKYKKRFKELEENHERRLFK